jgi:hypothetical protein
MWHSGGMTQGIRWGDDARFDDDDDGFDRAYECEWTADRGPDSQCPRCGNYYSQWSGDPCPAKAELVSYWVAHAPLPTS